MEVDLIAVERIIPGDLVDLLIVRRSCTAMSRINPTSAWVAQQMVEAFGIERRLDV